MTSALTPSKAASRLTRQLKLFSEVHGFARFPIDVEAVALESANLFQWHDPITEVVPANLKSFEGALFPNDKRNKWMLLYNKQMSSKGRVRYTQAHELGHYLIHRTGSPGFECSKDQMFDWSDGQSIEIEANQFAANLLMPLDDFRNQAADTEVSLETLDVCAERYGVSMTAAVLRWLEHTDESALAIASRDGYIVWAVSSARARRAGAFFRTRSGPPIEVPSTSLAGNAAVDHERKGQSVGSRIWFPDSAEDFALREMKLTSTQYDLTLSLLRLPRTASAWALKEWD